MMSLEALKKERPTEPGEYWIRKPGMKLLFQIQLKLKEGKLLISGEPTLGGMAVLSDYPIEDCEADTEWMTVEEAGEGF